MTDILAAAIRQLSGARQRYPFLPVNVRIGPLPDGATSIADFTGLEPDGTAIMRLRRDYGGGALLEPFDKIFMHECAHAGHALIRRAAGQPWYSVMQPVEQRAAKSADPTLRGFIAAMAYAVPYERWPDGYAADPVEHFGEAFGFIAAGLRAGDASLWSPLGGDLDARRSHLDAFFRSLPLPPEPVILPGVPDLDQRIAAFWPSILATPDEALTQAEFDQWVINFTDWMKRDLRRPQTTHGAFSEWAATYQGWLDRFR